MLVVAKMVYKYSVGQDPDCYPQTEVLINRLAITDADQLENAERELSGYAAQQLVWQPPPYDLQRLKDIHGFVFQDLIFNSGYEIDCLQVSRV